MTVFGGGYSFLINSETFLHASNTFYWQIKFYGTSKALTISEK